MKAPPPVTSPTTMPAAFAVEAEARGEIKRVLDGVVGATGRVWVLYADRRLLAPKIRAFVDQIFAWRGANGPT